LNNTGRNLVSRNTIQIGVTWFNWEGCHMDWLIPAIIGWCGTGWPWRWRFPGGGGGGFDPDNPWPPNCAVCGLITDIAGAVVAVLVVQALAGNELVSGLAGITIVSLAAGKVGGDIVNAIGGMAFRKTA
jgi:hypothetical protein